MGTPKFSALVRLLGPILSPATKKEVLEEIEEETLPPLSSMSFLSAVRSKVSKTPDTTKVLPFNFSVCPANCSEHLICADGPIENLGNCYDFFS